MGEVRRLSDPVSSPTNGLTTDVIRARAVEYYNNYLPHTPRPQSGPPLNHKSGSITQLNITPNGKMPPHHGIPTNRVGVYKDRTPTRNGSVIHYSSHPRGDRPHRTHSERSNRLFHPPIVAGHHSNKGNLVGSGTVTVNKLGLYRSNSSLDLEHDEMPDERLGALKREYGSASSLDVIGSTGENFFAMLRDYHHDNRDQRSPAPSKIQEYLRGRSESNPSTQTTSVALINGTVTDGAPEEAQSPKLKNKLHKLWEIKDKSGKVRSKVLGSEPSIFRKFRSNKSESITITTESSHRGSDNSLDAESRLEEKLRKKSFAHFDCQSLTANLNYASRLCQLLRKRRNTTTGASAASVLTRTPSGSTENLDPEESDLGDGHSSDLILSCPFFRNELGGEEERLVSLNKLTCKRQKFRDDLTKSPPTLYRPMMACGLSILENSNSNRWKHRACPYQKPSVSIDNVDNGALYYRQFFHSQEHQNWFGMDENFGPLAISVKREKVDEPAVPAGNQSLYRVIIRTSELAVMRGSVFEEAIPALSRSSSPRGTHAKEVLEYVVPELQLSCLRLAQPGAATEEQLIKLDEQGLTNTYKVGILYCKAGQATEEDMYNNEHSGPAFEEFLEMLGKRVRLKGFDKYRAGLDNKTDTCGLYSIYSTYHDNEIMFHVSTMLPYTPNNRQQLLRKRHIGNDIVTIVFQEPDALPFTPKSIRSHFQHVFIVIRAINPCTDHTRYSVAISRSKEVPVFGPAIPEGATFPKSKSFADFLLAKVINAENAAHHSEKFATMAQRTRQEYLKDLAANHTTNTTIDLGPKFSILSSFGGRKKERPRLRFIPDGYIRGAISWQVQIEDFGQSIVTDCILGISADTVVLIDESNKEVAFVCPCSAIIGWSSNTNSLKIFYHQGECLVLHTKDPDIDEVQEIVSRLSHVTQGCETLELILRRNSLGQLGFHVQYEGVVTEVEGYGFAFQAGLRQGSRLVEICKVAASTLSYDQMVDLLKTSMTVTVTVIPPFPEGQPRKGCTLHNCSYLSSSSAGGDYENIGPNDEGKRSTRGGASGQKVRSNGRARQENNSTGVHSLPSKNEQKYNSSNEKHTNHYINDSHKDHYHPHSLNAPSNRSDLPPPPLPPFVNSRNANTPSSYQNSSGSSNNLGSSTPNPSRSNKQPNIQSRSSPSTPYLPNPLPPPTSLHHNHAHHRSFHDHNSVVGRRLKPAPNGPLTHFGGMVASRSELSLNELVPVGSHGRSHAHHSSVAAIRSPPDYNYASRNGSSVVKTVANWSPLLIREPQDKDQPKSLPSVAPSTYSDYYSDSSSEWHQGTNSADELSGGSHRGTPPTRPNHHHHNHNNQGFRQETKLNGEFNGSISNSPNPTPVSRTTPRIDGRPNQIATSKSNHGRLRASTLTTNSTGSTVRNRTAGNYGTGTSTSSNSSGSSNSTLQEDLLKLISPDFLDTDSEGRLSSTADVAPSEGGSSNQTQTSTPYSSLERSGSRGSDLASNTSRPHTGTPCTPVMDPSQSNDVILTKAQPAQVISSEPSSPLPLSDSPMSREERLSPRVTTDRLLTKLKPLPPHSGLNSPVNCEPPQSANVQEGSNGEMDWSTIVEKATKALAVGIPITRPWLEELSQQIEIESSKTNGLPPGHVHDLQNKVWKLKQDLAKEQHQKANLEQEIHQLRQENQRLQEESQSASAQLRKFTQWFLHTMDS